MNVNLYHEKKLITGQLQPFTIIINALIMMMVICFPIHCQCLELPCDHPIEEGGATDETIKTGNGSDKWSSLISLSRAIEFETTHDRMRFAEPEVMDEKESDLSLTIDLAMDMQFSEWVNGFLLFQYSNGDDEVTLDEGFLEIRSEPKSFLYNLSIFFKSGKYVIPFGLFETALISDPVTVELGETRKVAVEIGGEFSGFQGSVILFDDDIDIDAKESRFNTIALTAEYAFSTDFFDMELGAGYSGNLIGSDGWTEFAVEEMMDAKEDGIRKIIRDKVAGFNFYASLHTGPLTVSAEHVAALDRVKWNLSESPSDAEDVTSLENGAAIDAVEVGIKPTVWHFEVSYGFDLFEKESELAISYQSSEKSGEIVPDYRYAGALSISMLENLVLSLEYLDEAFENGDKNDRITTQVALAF